MALLISQDDDGLDSVYADRTDPSAGELPERVTPTQATPAYAMSARATLAQGTVRDASTQRLGSPAGSARPPAVPRVSRSSQPPAPRARSSAPPAPPRRSSQPPASVFVDPSSQQPVWGPTDETPGPRRVAEPTLVLEGRRVDELRREVLRQHKKLKRRRGVHIVYWAAAGAAAVLAGGWLASGGELGDRLLGHVQEGDGIPELSVDADPGLRLGLQGHADDDAAEPASSQHTAAQQSGDDAPPGDDVAEAPAPSGAPNAVAAVPGTSAPPSPAAPAPAQPIIRSASRSPNGTKVPGDWGDGFDNAQAQRAPQPKAAKPRKTLSLDDLEEEQRLGF